MFYGDTIEDTRQVFFTSWRKYRQNLPLEELEHQVVAVILGHPEYHELLEQAPTTQAYFPELGETNPFLHMGLHLSIREQVNTNRPFGITTIYQQLLTKYNDAFTVEHLLMEQLAECLWQAQRLGIVPNEQSYLAACQKLA